ncbi:hypothetical protein SOM12_04140 [Flavobacterium sp. CFBP9031]|uniref:hypothetical protein n=1 Tax=Flavobacterium sp. CFBP9031 TaxID=3096538 RepID=UPI002A69C03C|nr:hypothetical protein [Flavobacterium sp. CFBP9031]MDY0986592.1 hypothetical protein [Flavobacterium sp. CFBP9031]
MKNQIAFVLITLALFSCNSKQQEKNNPKKEIVQESSKANKTENTAKTAHYEISVYDDPQFTDRILDTRESLKQLSNEKLFSNISAKFTAKLDEKQHQFFKTNADYELLSFAKGSIFQNNSEDYIFIVYDAKNNRTKILLFNATTNTYAELYKDIKVENGLENADCGSYSFGTLDYQFAVEHLITNEDAIRINPEYYLESPPVKITDISKDENFALKDGCFSKKASKKNFENTLCISTSPVYNNWDCLKYNKTTNTFLIFYSQAFAD